MLRPDEAEVRIAARIDADHFEKLLPGEVPAVVSGQVGR
jgi:hypothetical protein